MVKCFCVLACVTLYSLSPSWINLLSRTIKMSGLEVAMAQVAGPTHTHKHKHLILGPFLHAIPLSYSHILFSISNKNNMNHRNSISKSGSYLSWLPFWAERWLLKCFCSRPPGPEDASRCNPHAPPMHRDPPGAAPSRNKQSQNLACFIDIKMLFMFRFLF